MKVLRARKTYIAHNFCDPKFQYQKVHSTYLEIRFKDVNIIYPFARTWFLVKEISR